jgi:hypothetical protein
MAEYDETTYGERIAEVYDLFYEKRDNSETDSILLLAGTCRSMSGARDRLSHRVGDRKFSGARPGHRCENDRQLNSK